MKTPNSLKKKYGMIATLSEQEIIKFEAKAGTKRVDLQSVVNKSKNSVKVS